MWIRAGNLVRHKVGGGPIMYVQFAPSLSDWCHCVWVEDRMRKYECFPVGALYTVYADGTPRDYDEEN
jgi:hypothetical protein